MSNSSSEQELSAKLVEIGSAIQFVIGLVGTVANLRFITEHLQDPLKTFKATSSWPFIINIAVFDLVVSTAYLMISLLIFVNLRHSRMFKERKAERGVL